MVDIATLSPPADPSKAIIRLPEHWLRRPRLLSRLAGVSGGQTMLIASLAGSGKTTLLVDWFTNERTADGGWVTLDRRHNERGRFASACAAALGFDTIAETATGPDTIVIDQLFAAIEARGVPTVLVLDDVHELRSRSANEAVGHLALYAPALLTLVLSTRADPPIRIHRLRLAGRLQQLRTRDLAFTTGETADLMRAYGVLLDSDAAESLHDRMGGWAGGILLAANALATGRDRRRFIDDLVNTQSVLSDFLLTEVFESQVPAMQQFLLRACVARSLTVDLARELTSDDNAAGRLSALERAGIMSRGGDADPHYEFHALFGSLLRARLRHEDPRLAQRLGASTARWYLEHDMLLDAETHAFDAGDWALGGALACRRWVERSVRRGTVTPFEFDAPREVCVDVSDLALLTTANAIAVGDHRAARMWRSRADELGRPADATVWSDVARLLVDVLYARAFGADSRGRLAVRTLMRTDIGRDTPALLALARLREAEIALDADADDEAALRALTEARWRASRVALQWAVDASDLLLALIASLHGYIEECDSLLGSIPKHDDQEIGMVDVRSLARAVCAAQRGRLTTARELLNEPSAANTGHAVTIALEEARRRAGATNGAFANQPAHPLAYAVQVAFGALDAAAPGSAEAQVARARQLAAKGNAEDVVRLLHRFAIGKDRHVHVRTRIEALALVASAADRVHDDDLVLKAFSRALDLAQGADLRAPLIAHSDELSGLLDRYAWQLGHTSGYAAELVDSTREAEAPVFVEPLTERERAVLGYLPTMMSNAEIAKQLLMSVNTVKTHLKSVYRKLGVERRRDAVVRARQFELL
jgi:LuxR family maltose regulon positive regulatory protein